MTTRDPVVPGPSRPGPGRRAGAIAVTAALTTALAALALGASTMSATPAGAACDIFNPQSCGFPHISVTTVTACNFRIERSIYDYWRGKGGQAALGCPTSNTLILTNGSGSNVGLYNDFGTRASIVLKTSGQSGGPHLIVNGIRSRYVAVGFATGFLGFPLEDERLTINSTGWFQGFENGRIFYSDATGAHELHGYINTKWESIGNVTSFLGYPTTDETGTPDGVGRYNHFSGGSIYWTSALGAHPVRGPIRDHWAAQGWERSFLGYPTGDDLPLGTSNLRFQEFQHGFILWDTVTGGVQEVRD
jgi:uncharacterized protein with LGFP repeats